jgi:hypothetical protein
MWYDGLHSEYGTGTCDGGITQAESISFGSGGSGRGGDGAISQKTWFEPVDSTLDSIVFLDSPTVFSGCTDGFCPMPTPKVDMVNHPPHYANSKKKIETIDKIEDAVQFAPDAVLGGLQWQIIKYIDRMWDKEDPKKDAMKAKWYLERLIDKLS